MKSPEKILLASTHQIIRHQKELEVARGESFNIFSILKLETKENQTHSAFIAELLDPTGTHNMGSIFLKCFLEALQFKKAFDVETAAVHREFFVGQICHQKKTGGRIDILLVDADGNSISIENKIYAGDQIHQVQRYVNYNRSKNTVYYLTLFGDEPAEESKGLLVPKDDYECISYASLIVDWLEACQREAVQVPILRESVRQYIILIKKLTHQLLDEDMENEIKTLVSKNYTAARAISNAIEQAEVDATNRLLLKIKDELLKNDVDGWTVEIEDDLFKNWTGLDFWRKVDDEFWIRIEGNPRIYNSTSYFGLYPDDEESHKFVSKIVADEDEYFSTFRGTKNWPCFQLLDEMNFDSDAERAKLFDENEVSKIAISVAKKLLELKSVLSKYIT